MAILTAIAFLFLGVSLLFNAGTEVWPFSVFSFRGGSAIPPGKRKLTAILATSFFLLLVVILTAGYLFVQSTFSEFRSRQRNELKEIVDLKVRQISEWYSDSVSDAEIFYDNAYARKRALGLLLGTMTNDEKKDLNSWVEHILTARKDRFDQLTLYNVAGRPVLSYPQVVTDLPNSCSSREFQTAIASRGVYIKDIHFEDPAITGHRGRARICVWIPVRRNGPDQPAEGVWQIQISPEKFLFPFIQDWPTPSQTAETLLVRREGGNVVFLNKLRHRDDESLTLKFDIAGRSDLPAAMAVKGISGIVDGSDYRGVPVMSAIRSIPGTNWFLIGKIDKDEIYSRPREIAVFTGVFLLVLIFMIYLGIGLLWGRMMHDAVFNEKERLFVTLRSIGDGVIVADMRGKIILMNGVAEKLTGWPLNDAVGKSLIDVFNIINEQTGEPCENPVQKVIQTGLIVGLANHTVLIRRDGSRKPIDDSGAPVRDRAGNMIGVVLVFRDITEQQEAEKERKRLEEGIQQAQKLESLGILAGGIAHDFNNLLTGMLGYATLAIEALPKASPVLGHLEEIEKSACRAADLTRQLLAYSGKGRFVIEPLNLSAIVEDMAHLLEISISKKCALKYHFTADLPTVDADVVQIRQIVMNLILNASEAIGDKNGIITIATGSLICDDKYLASSFFGQEISPGRYVYLEVSDTGHGMNEEVKTKIFDPFFTTKFAGRGLGLAATLGIVRGHKGAIKVYSEPGRGSTFKVLLPAGSGSPVQHEKRDNLMKQQKGQGMILVVDDEETIRELTKRVLETGGFKVLTATDGKKALEIFQTNKDTIRAVILDLTMPNMDGEETFRELRRIRSDVKVLLSSGYNEQDTISHFAGKGLAGFLQKPYSVKGLLEAVSKVINSDNPEATDNG